MHVHVRESEKGGEGGGKKRREVVDGELGTWASAQAVRAHLPMVSDLKEVENPGDWARVCSQGVRALSQVDTRSRS